MNTSTTPTEILSNMVAHWTKHRDAVYRRGQEDMRDRIVDLLGHSDGRVASEVEILDWVDP